MKKILSLLIIVAAALNASADNYFSVEGAVNDTLLINPIFVGNGINIKVCAHFDGRVDRWTVTISHPNDTNVTVNSVTSGNGMQIPYTASDGSNSIYFAPLTVDYTNSIISSIITDFGYWDHNNDGIYEPYGTIKWEAGDHDDMFRINYTINIDCSGDSISLDSYVEGTFDWRGGTTNGAGFKKIYLKVGYKLGDVNGDGKVNISDVATLQAYLLGDEALDQYQLDAADLNRDGNVNIQDAAELIIILLQNGTIQSLDELTDI